MEFLDEGWVVAYGDRVVGDSPSPLLIDNRARLWIVEDTVLIGDLHGMEMILRDSAWPVLDAPAS